MKKSLGSRSTGGGRQHPATELLALLLALQGAGTAFSQEGEPGVPADEAGTEIPKEDGVAIHGSVRLRAISRGTSDGTDADVYASTYLEIGNGERDRVTGLVDAYLAWDVLDSDDDAFFSHSDTYGSDVDARLYQVYVDVHRVAGLDHVRIGRQELWETPVFLSFDGLSAETREIGRSKIQAGAYGGVSFHTFESSNSEDYLGGIFLRARPWAGTRVRFDYLHAQDETVLGDADNDLLTLSGRQAVGPWVDVEAEYSYLDSESLEYRLAADARDPEAGWNVRFTYYELFETKARLVNELDPYFLSLHELFPYHQTSLSASTSVGEWVLLSGGLNLRRVGAKGDEGEFNRDFERYHASASLLDLGSDGLDLTLTGEVWDSDLSDVATWGVDLDLPLSDETQASLGSYYSLYKYDYLVNAERDNVRTYFVGLEHELGEQLDLDFDYEFEVNDLDHFQTLRLGLSWRF